VERIERAGSIAGAALIALLVLACGKAREPSPPGGGVAVNDVHSKLNSTRVARVVTPHSVEEIRQTIRQAAKEGMSISIAGARHAMGGQQFGDRTILIDMTGMNRVLNFDREHGLVEAEAGIDWPRLVDYLLAEQKDAEKQWGIRQKQTGADRLTLGGALSANAHGRGLTLKPIVQDVEQFTLIDAEGAERRCSRSENPELFRLTIGGYGLFGVIAKVTLRLAPRQKVERVVEVIDVDRLMPAFEQRVADGYLYGDFQYAIDPESPDFLKRGVFSSYRPVDASRPIPEGQKELSADNWRELYFLAHTDKSKAFGIPGYVGDVGAGLLVRHAPDGGLRRELSRGSRPASRRDRAGVRMITEIYVPRGDLAAFMAEARDFSAPGGSGPIYGTVRLIRRRDLPSLGETELRLHHLQSARRADPAGSRGRRAVPWPDRSGDRPRRLFLTYHSWATPEQLAPATRSFRLLAPQGEYDPGDLSERLVPALSLAGRRPFLKEGRPGQHGAIVAWVSC
jgi:FAD/FMN-containing dehydrogenase